MASISAARWLYWLGAPIVFGILSFIAANALVDRVDWINQLEGSLIVERSMASTKGRTTVSNEIVVLTVDDQSFERLRLNGARIDRREYARLLRSLKQAGVRAAMLDITFETERKEEDAELAKTVKDVGPDWLTLGYFSLEHDGDFPSEPDGHRSDFIDFPQLTTDRSMYGSIIPLAFDEGVVGQVLVRKDWETLNNVYAAAFLTVLNARRIDVESVRWEPGSSSVQAGGYEWIIHGNQNIFINWPKEKRPFPEYSIASVLLDWNDAERRQKLDGKMVFIGFDRARVDRLMTPMGEIPGVVFHAHLANTLVQQSSARVVGTESLTHWLWGSVLAIISAWSLLSHRFPFNLISLIGAVVLAYFVPITVAHQFNSILETTSVVIGIGLAASMGAILSRTIAPPKRPRGAVFEATVVMFDMRGSTELMGMIGPRAFAKVYTFWGNRLKRLATKYKGEIERTTGDGAIVLFSAERLIHHADAAIQFAQAVCSTTLPGGASIVAGIESGSITGDYVWESGRWAWSSVSLAVNRAARIQAAVAKEGVAIGIGGTAKGLMKNASNTVLLGEFELKGFERPEPIWTVITIGGDHEPTKNITGASDDGVRTL